MGKKSFSLKYDSPLVLSFAILSFVVFVLDCFAFKGKLVDLCFVCKGAPVPEASGGFDFSSPACYLGLIFHIFGNSSWQNFFVDVSFVLVFGKILEERYGTAILGLMFFATTLVSGVLTACLSPFPLTGAREIVLMMIILASLVEVSKKQIPLTYSLILILYISLQMCNSQVAAKNSGFSVFMQGNIPVFICMAAGICGSLFGFMVAPKKSRASAKDSEKTEKKSETKEFYSISDDEDDLYTRTPKNPYPGSKKKNFHKEEEIGSISLD